jgi:hypothetical protein
MHGRDSDCEPYLCANERADPLETASRQTRPSVAVGILSLGGRPFMGSCRWSAARNCRAVQKSERFEGEIPELLLAIPEHKVPLPPKRGRPSQNDVFALIKVGDQIISTAVEGKVNEAFGPTVAEWWTQNQYDEVPKSLAGKEERLAFLCSQLRLSDRLEAIKNDAHLRYQLLHRAVSAIIEAKRFNADFAAIIVHSFADDIQWEQELDRFLKLFGKDYRRGSLVEVPLRDSRVLLVGAAVGEKEHRDGTEKAQREADTVREVAKAYAGYLKGFNDCDMPAINAVVRYHWPA